MLTGELRDSAAQSRDGRWEQVKKVAARAVMDMHLLRAEPLARDGRDKALHAHAPRSALPMATARTREDGRWTTSDSRWIGIVWHGRD